MNADPLPLGPDQLEKAAFVLKTIAHPLRLGIVQLLGHHEHLSVGEICQHTGCEQSLVSHHLNILKLKGVLHSQRRGKFIYYRLELKEVLAVISCMKAYSQRG
ncbi:MAG: metalloregulator ArsR/SmtB family transcription factor [Bacteroidota bacterium]